MTSLSPNGHLDQNSASDLSCATFVVNCTALPSSFVFTNDQLATPASRIRMSRSNTVLLSGQKHDSGSYFCPPTSGVSRSCKWTLTSADGGRIINFSGSSGSAACQGNSEDYSELWKKRVKARLGCKRKASEPVSSFPHTPPKIFINEKQISTCLSRLTLDNNNLDDHPDLEEEPWYDLSVVPRRSQSEVSFTNLLDRVNSNCNSKLVLCHGLQLGLRKTPVFPNLVQSEINEHLMQVVLWKSPGGFAKSIAGNLPSGLQQSLFSTQEDVSTSDVIAMKPDSFNDRVYLQGSTSSDDSQRLVETAITERHVKDMQEMDTEEW